MIYAGIAVVCFVAGGVVTHLYEGKVIKYLVGLEERFKSYVDNKL